MDTTLSFHVLHFTAALEESSQVVGDFGTALRGSFVEALLEQFCLNQEHPAECPGCPFLSTCQVKTLIAPVRNDKPFGSDAPRPYIVRPALEAGFFPEFSAGDTFSFDIVVVGKSWKLLPLILQAIPVMERNGLGKAMPPGTDDAPQEYIPRAPFTIERVEAVHPYTRKRRVVYEPGLYSVRPDTLPVVTAQDVAERAEKISATSVTVRFVMPVSLDKHKPTTPLYPDLFLKKLAARITSFERAEHVSVESGDEMLAGKSSEGRWFTLVEASSIRLESQQTKWTIRHGYSSRQDQIVNYGGYTGLVTYGGDWSPDLRKLLVMGELVHVGRGATRGNGWYEILDGSVSQNQQTTQQGNDRPAQAQSRRVVRPARNAPKVHAAPRSLVNNACR